jgi:lysophospholipase L1-like esterase
VIALGGAEALARIFGPPAEFSIRIPIWNVPTRTVDGVVLWTDNNPRCSSEDIRRAAADPTGFTILGLGDSIMYGVGTQENYLEYTRRLLAGRTERPLHFLNLSVPGYNTLQENAVYKEIEDQIKPDLVLVHYWQNDVAQYRVAGGYVVDYGDISEDGQFVVRALPLPAAVSDYLLLHSRLYEMLTKAVVAYRRNGRPNDWTRVSEPLAAIHERTRRAGGRLLVLASAVLDGPTPQPIEDIPRLRELASRHGFELIDLSQWLRGADTKRIALDQCHFSVEGHRLIGERLAEYLLQHDLRQ